MNWLLVEENVKRALNEDLQYGDITTESVVLDHKIAKIDIIAKEKGVIAGTEVFKMVFKILGDVEVDFSVNDGEEVEKGQHFGQVSGDAKKILMGERVALNYMQRMCGIATLTRESIEQLKEALEAKADIIMLDNMDIKTLKESVKLIDNRVEVEASGNVTLDNIREIAKTGVDFISTGSVTHSFKVLDISMKNFRYID